MKTNRIILSLALLLFVAGYASAQTNFSGTWVLNESKSTFPDTQFRMASPAFVITQDGSTFTIERTFRTRDGEERKMSEKYTLDGKESLNPFMNTQKKSTAAWSADKMVLTVNSVMVFEFNGESNEVKQTDIYKLNGNVLNLDTKSTSQMGELASALVYDKK